MGKSSTIAAEIVEPEATELVITKMQPGLTIEGNFEAVKAHIESLVADYKGLVVTEDYVGQAKKDRAYLNSLATSLTQRFREVKRSYMAPVEKLDMQIKELEAPIKEASAAIDVQVKAFEERERVSKRAELVKHWEEYAGILANAVPFERIEAASWANKTCDLMTAFADIEHIVERIAKEEATLDSLNLSHPADAKTAYLATLDMSAAIARSKELDDREERTRRFEAEKTEIAAQQAKPVVAPEPALADEVERAKAEEIAEGIAELVAECSTFTFSVVCTDAQRAAIIGNLRAMGLTGTVRKVAS